MLEIIPCPQCGAPAEITQRFWLDSTDGPIQHLKTICLSKHWRTPRAETVHQPWPATRPQLRDRAELLGPGAAGVRANTAGDQDGRGVAPMCLRCGVVDQPYRSWPQGPAGPGNYGPPPALSPPEYGPAPTGGVFGIGAPGRDYRMTTGRWDRGRAIGGILTKLRIIR